MPWKDKTVEEQRMEFVTRALSKEKNKSALCREYGISRPTGDKWIKRYENAESLSDKSRRPFHTANRISPKVEEIIVEARRQEPAIGARKTKRMLESSGLIMPAMSTINEVFRRNGLITKEASQAATPYTRFEKEAPNDMWQADFKGNFEMQNKVRCHPISIIDDHSRYCLNGDAKICEQLASTQESFIRAFEMYGLPISLLCDNGSPFRVAAYCRVSSPSDEQELSLETQIAYYSDKINSNTLWKNTVVFADTATGRNMKNRTEFKKLLAKCRTGTKRE